MRHLFAVALVVALASPSAAAGLYPDGSAPSPQRAAVFGAGWYMRGDIEATELYGMQAVRGADDRAFGLGPRQQGGHELSAAGG